MLQSFGYFRAKSDRIDDWAEYGEKFLGLQIAERTKSAVRFRMDDRKQRIVIASDGSTDNAFGWDVEDAAALDALAGRIEAARIKVERVSGPDLAMRAVAGAIRFTDPAGNRLEAFHGPEIDGAPFEAGRPISGFRTGALGMGHAVLHVESVKDVQWFYQDVLGFRLSDYTLSPFVAYFFHLNPRHHSFAMLETGRRGIHHIMMELTALDDVGQGYDLALAAGKDRIATSLGRHTNDFMTSFYARTPNEFFVEYGWGGRSIDLATWKAEEMHYGPSLWGHDRTWMPEDQLAEARALRAKAAHDGLRAPAQVIDGNYEVGVGSCAWWSGLKGQG